jgi:hypothetical protein
LGCYLVLSDELRIACLLVSVCFYVAHVFVAALPFNLVTYFLNDAFPLFAFHFRLIDEHIQFIWSVNFDAEQYW